MLQSIFEICQETEEEGREDGDRQREGSSLEIRPKIKGTYTTKLA